MIRRAEQNELKRRGRRDYTRTNKVQGDPNYFSCRHWIANTLLRSKIYQYDRNQKSIQAIM